MTTFNLPGSELDGKERSPQQQEVYERTVLDRESLKVYGKVGSGKTSSLLDIVMSLRDEGVPVLLIIPPKLAPYYTKALKELGVFDPKPSQSDTYFVGYNSRNYPASIEPEDTDEYGIVVSTPQSSLQPLEGRWLIVDEYGSGGSASIDKYQAEGYTLYLDSTSSTGADIKADIILLPRTELSIPTPMFRIAEPSLHPDYRKKLKLFNEYQHVLVAVQNNNEFKEARDILERTHRDMFAFTKAKTVYRRYQEAVNRGEDTLALFAYGSKVPGYDMQDVDALIIFGCPVYSSLLQLIGRVVRPSEEDRAPLIYFFPRDETEYHLNHAMVFLYEEGVLRASRKDGQVIHNLIEQYPETAYFGLHLVQSIDKDKTTLTEIEQVLLTG